MRKQFLYLDKAGFYYNAPGNISIGAGSKGTVFFWYYPAPGNSGDQPIWEANFDSRNFLRLGYTGANQLSFGAYANGVWQPVNWSGFVIGDHQRWVPVACTWDFTTAGAGKLRLYFDGQEASVRVDNATAPQGEALRLYLGARPGTTSTGLDGHLDNVTVWSGVMTLAQYQALCVTATDHAARQAARRRIPVQADGTGTMTFLATFDGQYDAQYAAGDPAAQWMVTAEDYHHFALVDDGSRSRGNRFTFRFGIPRHDNSDDDRVPIRAIMDKLWVQGADQYTTLVDRTTHSEINISQLKAIEGQGQGVGWLRGAVDPSTVLKPATVRMRVNLPDSTNPKSTKICLGPLTYISGGKHGDNFSTWGTGESFSVVANAGNGAATFKTSLSARTDAYWQNAEISMQTGVCAGCRLKVTGYTASTGVLTLAGSLPGTPAAGDTGFVNFRGRLIPTGYPSNETQTLDAWLWEEYGDDRPWIELEAVLGGLSSARYQRGRTAYMDLTSDRSDVLGRNIMFGRNGFELPSSFSCNILIESLIVDGPGSYQVMSPDDARGRRGFELADTMLVRDLANGHSARVWRAQNCSWATATPTQCADSAAVLADLQVAGSWRQSVFIQRSVQPWDEADSVLMLVRGTDPAGVKRLGYVRGVWNATTNRITWTDETPPAGQSNPFLAMSALRPWEASDSTWGLNGDPGMSQVYQMPDGTWSLLVMGNEDNPDHYLLRALHGAPDRWSFSPQQHWWPENPLLPGFGGVDMLPPMGGGISLFGNRDAEWVISYNPYARDPGRRFSGWARLKTMVFLPGQIAANRRPLAGWTSPDLKSFFLLPHGNGIAPLAAAECYAPAPYAVSDDVTAIAAEFIGGIRLWASDDDRHFQQVVYSFLPEADPLDVFVLGDRRVYYYTAGGLLNLAYQTRDRESFYQLTAGQLSGWVETPILERPADGWGSLIVNVSPEQGSLRAEVVDPRTEAAIGGYGAEDCDTTSDGVAKRLTWRSVDLGDLTAEAIRLRFYFSRTSTSQVSPKLFAWRIAAPEAVQPPSASVLRVEDRENPAGIVDSTPSFSWTYSDAKGNAQVAYQLQVASSQEKLDGGEADLWDTAVQSGDATEVVYAGAPLRDVTTYFWRLRVQNTEGVWSAEW